MILELKNRAVAEDWSADILAAPGALACMRLLCTCSASTKGGSYSARRDAIFGLQTYIVTSSTTSWYDDDQNF